MVKEYVVLFLFSHFLGDFIFQSTKLADKKREKLRFLWIHCICYMASVFLVFIPIWNKQYFYPLLLFSVSHAIIDCTKYGIQKTRNPRRTNKTEEELSTSKKELTVFLIDQCFHLFFVIAFSLYVSEKKLPIQEIPLLQGIKYLTGLTI